MYSFYINSKFKTAFGEKAEDFNFNGKIKTLVKMTRKYHNQTLQTNSRHCMREIPNTNSHKKAGRQLSSGMRFPTI